MTDRKELIEVLEHCMKDDCNGCPNHYTDGRMACDDYIYGMSAKPNKVTATLKVVVTGEFYDDEASEETLRYCVEQDLEEVGFDVDVELLKEDP